MSTASAIATAVAPVWFEKSAITFSSLSAGNSISYLYEGKSTSITASTSLIFKGNHAADEVITFTFGTPSGVILYSTFTSGVPTATSAIFNPAAAMSTTSNAISISESQSTAESSQATPDTTSASITSTDAGSLSTPTGSSTMIPKGKDGVSSGAVAGVAIGCLLAGALIAGLLAFFFLRKKKQNGVRDSEASSMALIHREKGPVVGARSLEKVGARSLEKVGARSLESRSLIAGALEANLPLPLEDKAISGEISKISNLIKNHVQSYYHAGRVSPILIDYDDLQALGDDMPVSVGTLSTLLGNSATREIALRFCIAWIVVSRMQLRSPPSTTFLPPEVSQCFQAMDLEPKVHATYFSRWRAITAELMQSAYVRNPFSASDTRLHNLQLASTLLNNILRPYSDSRMDDGQRSRNLEEILKRSALFAFTLFSQPSTWEFDWDNGQDVKSGSLCIFPALLQVKDENGEIVKPARPFNEAVIRRLDE